MGSFLSGNAPARHAGACLPHHLFPYARPWSGRAALCRAKRLIRPAGAPLPARHRNPSHSLFNA